MKNQKTPLLRPSAERGFFNHGWLETYHSFSFGDYFDPAWQNFGALRVINEDKVQAGAGFPTHPHRDMEIITYVYEGALEHKDSVGNSSVIRPGEIQRMSAGTGIRHSEFNHYSDKDAKLLQIWIMPDRGGYAPGYEQKDFRSKLTGESLVRVVSSMRQENRQTVGVNQNATIDIGKFSNPHQGEWMAEPGLSVWFQVIHGKLTVSHEKDWNLVLGPGDGAGIPASGIQVPLVWQAGEGSEFLVLQVPPIA